MKLEVLHKISSHRDAGLRSAWSHRDDAAHAESSFSQCFQGPAESPLEFLET